MDFIDRQFGAAEILLHELVVELDCGLDRLVTRGFDGVLELGRHVDDLELLAHRRIVEDELAAGDDVDMTGERLAAADRQLQRERTTAEPVANHRQAAIEVGADAIHLVREDHPRHAVTIGLLPHGLCLRFDTGDRIEQRHATVKHTQRALDFDGEVDVPGGVDDVDAILGTRSLDITLAVPLPERRGGSRRDGDAALLLLLHPVHGRGAVVHFTDLVVLAGVIQDALGRSRLPGINVGHDADVPVQFERRLTSHIHPCHGAQHRAPVSPNQKAGRPAGLKSPRYRSAPRPGRSRDRNALGIPAMFEGPEVKRRAAPRDPNVFPIQPSIGSPR